MVVSRDDVIETQFRHFAAQKVDLSVKGLNKNAHTNIREQITF